jgi:NAD(P)-dependent dehydrogenase (short-subunit alcohol dehydrogenase family)
MEGVLRDLEGRREGAKQNDAGSLPLEANPIPPMVLGSRRSWGKDPVRGSDPDGWMSWLIWSLVMKKLEGSTVLVTGGGSGIGQAIALRLAGEGAQVAISGRRFDRLEETLSKAAEQGQKLKAWPLDVTDVDAVEQCVKEVASDLGGLAILVNNAGLGGPNRIQGGVHGDDEDRWREVLSVNLDGMFYTTRAALRVMPDGGTVINISSVLGKFGVPGYTAYCTSKHGVIGFTKSLALELAPRQIRVNAICPGWVDTEMAREGMEDMASNMGMEFDEARKLALSQVPLGRILETSEIAGLCAWLASPEARGMTGQAINLSGGSAMH